jgi:cytochrome c-L
VFALRRFRDLHDLQRVFDAWRTIYDLERPHEALSVAVPASRYRPSPRSMPDRLADVEYDSHEIVRRVSTTKAYVSFKGRLWRVPQAFRGQRLAIAALAVNVLAIPFAVAGDLADFKSPLDNSPMIFEVQSGEVETPVVKKYKEMGVNGYRGDADGIADGDAIADGKKLYTLNCIVCHGADGTGKMGPTIVGKDALYKQVLTDPGMFAIIYGGASGAMQS